MKYVWVAAAVAPLAFAASIAHAQTTVSAATSTPLVTSSAGNVTITANGSITLPASTVAPAAAVTINGNNTVNNAGGIAATGLSGTGVTALVTGIHALGGNTGEIINSGAISLSETDTTSDTNSDGVIDTENGVKGQYASGGYRAGILIDGPGTFTGVVDTTDNSTGDLTAIYNASTITVVGENSYGIAVLTNVNGDMVINGAISVTGGNYNTTDVSYGVLTTGQVTGNVTFGGTVTATGGNAVGVALLGGVNGAVTVSGSITDTGYRNTTPRTSFALGTIALIEATPSEVMQSGPAFVLAGNVTGGLDVTAAVAATSTTSAVGGGSITAYGNAPALLIGSATTATNLGSVAGDTGGHGLVIGGDISGNGAYDNVNAFGVVIGGLGKSVNITNGISISGTISASSYGNAANPSFTGGNGSATGLLIGAGATVPVIDNSGSIGASALTNIAQNNSPPAVTAIEINGAAPGMTINNTGSIAAAIGSTDVLVNNVSVAQGGTAGTAYAILDTGNSIKTINNYNSIVAGFTAANTTDTVTGQSYAIYLNNTSAVTINQASTTITTTSGTTTTTTTTTPTITGDIDFGSGVGIINASAGTITGDTTFGDGGTSSTGNQINLSGGTVMKGGLTVGTGGNLTVSLNDATLNITNVTGTSFISPGLTLQNNGELIFAADPSGTEALKNTQFDVSAAPNTLHVSNGMVGLNLLSAIPGASYSNPVHFVVILANAGDAAQLSNFTLGSTPYLYHAALDTTYQPDALTIDVTRATASQLNLNGNETAAYNAIYNAFTTDAGVTADMLSKNSETSFKKLYDQFLPDFAGGPFESLAIGQRAIIREQETDPLKLETDQTRGWVQEIGFLTHQGDADSAGYNAGGFGVAVGAEEARGSGVVGVSGAFLSTEVTDAGQDSYGHMAGSLLEAGLYWRSNSSAINANASVDGGYAWFDSQRQVLDTGPNPASLSNPNLPTTTATLQRIASAQWGGGLVSAQFGLNAPIEFGHFYIRPEFSADYIALFEEGYTEHGGGSAFDLSIAPRTSQQASGQVDLVLGATFGDAIKYRPELMVGWRGVVYGGPGDTNAHFVGGSNFTLTPNFQDKGGLLARLGLRAGGQFADFTADAGGEWHGNFDSYDARALARFLF